MPEILLVPPPAGCFLPVRNSSILIRPLSLVAKLPFKLFFPKEKLQKPARPGNSQPSSCAGKFHTRSLKVQSTQRFDTNFFNAHSLEFTAAHHAMLKVLFYFKNQYPHIAPRVNKFELLSVKKSLIPIWSDVVFSDFSEKAMNLSQRQPVRWFSFSTFFFHKKKVEQNALSLCAGPPFFSNDLAIAKLTEQGPFCRGK